MWVDTRLDQKLQQYLTRCGVKNLDTVKAVHAFGVGHSYDEDGNPLENPNPIIHHRIFNFSDLKPEYEEFYREYHRVMVVFKNGGTAAWDFIPSEWERINEILELEICSAE